MRSTVYIFLSFCLAASLQAQVVEWAEGAPIDVAVVASEGSTSRIRMVQLPCERVTQIVQAKDDPALTIEVVQQRTLAIQVSDASYTGGLRAFDETGRLYVINIYAAADGTSVDDVLLVKLPSVAKSGSAVSQLRDTDAAVTHLNAVMAGGVNDQNVVSAPVTQVVRGQVVVGRSVGSDDQMSVTITRAFRAQPPLVGYETTWTWRGPNPVGLPIQRLWFPGAISVTSQRLGTLSSTAPEVVLLPNVPTKIWYTYVER